jgi:hypothetical protein
MTDNHDPLNELEDSIMNDQTKKPDFAIGGNEANADEKVKIVKDEGSASGFQKESTESNIHDQSKE